MEAGNGDSLLGTVTPSLVPFDNLQPAWFAKPLLQFRPVPFMSQARNWSVVASACGTGSSAFSLPNVTNASRHYKLFASGDECFGDSGGAAHMIAEWGYEFEVFTPKAFPMSDCVNLTNPTYGIASANRSESAARMGKYFECRQGRVQARTNVSTVMQLTCHYYYSGLAALLGSTAMVAAEVGENGNSINAHYAFTRGAARQFRVPWMIDFSAWMAGYITDFSTSRPWGSASSAGGNGGHSLSLFKRTCVYRVSRGPSCIDNTKMTFGDP